MPNILELRDVHTYYDKSHVLQGTTFHVSEGQIVSLLGRNGSGRSTTMKSVCGMVPPRSGSILFRGQEISRMKSFSICRQGIAFVPEEREVFKNLSVDENLYMGVQKGAEGSPHWTIDQMFDYFPKLKERRNTKAGSLSGGEQQMLTICRSLLGNPLLILIDEPTEGLAPQVVTAVGEAIQDINSCGVSVLLVEQKLTIAMKISHQVCVMGHGEIVFEGTPDELLKRQDIIDEWIAV